MSTAIRTIFGDPVQWPRRRVRAFVGALASDFLGDYATPAKAYAAAKAAGYGCVHVMYLNGDADSLAVTS